MGFADALAPANLLWALVGVTIGVAVGALPGIGPAPAVALLLPLTFRLDPTAALIMFAGVYYGGSSASVLLGTHASLEVNRVAPIGRFVGGTIGAVALLVAAPFVAGIAVHFGPPEYVALMAVVFATVSALAGPSLLKGAASLVIGAAIGLVGQNRLTFGMPSLFDGIDVVVVVIALFALGGTFAHLVEGTGESRFEPVRGKPVLSREDFRRSWPAWLRGTALGFPFGAKVSAYLSYRVEKRLSRNSGAIEGVAGPAAALSAASVGALLPLLAIGLPTSATAAVILTAFPSYGLQPGPQLFSESGDLVWALIASLFVGHILLLALTLSPARVRLPTIPAYGIHAGVLVFACLGAFAAGGTIAALVVLTALGLVGLLMREAGVPVAPAVVGLVLAPSAEQQLRRALASSEGDWTVLVSSPLTVTLWIVAVLVLLTPLVVALRASRRS
ncbi:tripartite tricarboxylate transporter permease [Actinoplanes sp. LDG1-06]|uniref:Tripartite tricarboxylate transporter permease n=1 Tax=Paractinoplanes ovalisporus TaxID=2810368 RepID=A0ABS2A483_9ACTN|nr:tripartite tricarboxylate transporter permease [Actinoplanes ovalisporus]MBM2614653.1 tripartite tricarboxylate transporter permease [Actinoplanes ovalisporus]